MISFNPTWGGQDVIQDTAPADGMCIYFLPSEVNDVVAGALQLDSAESARSFMQAQFRAATENMYGVGVIVSASI